MLDGVVLCVVRFVANAPAVVATGSKKEGWRAVASNQCTKQEMGTRFFFVQSEGDADDDGKDDVVAVVATTTTTMMWFLCRVIAVRRVRHQEHTWLFLLSRALIA